MSRRWANGLVAVLACLAMIGLHAYTGETPDAHTTRVALGKPGRLYDSTATVNSWSIGQSLYHDGVFAGRTGAIFLAVNLTVVNRGAQRGTGWQVGGTANGRSFAAGDPLTMPEPGFRITQAVVFELSPDDLAGFTLTILDRAPIYAYDPRLEIDLGISASAAAERLERDRYAAVETSRGRTEVDR